MRNPDTMLRVYEELADRFIAQNEPRFRDHCLVLAADAALAADRADEAERVRQRLLQENPHHLLRPFASMSEAVQAPDVQEYVADLRRQWPPEFVQKLYIGGRDMPMPAEPVAADRATPLRTERGTKDATVTPVPAPPVQAKPVDTPAPRPLPRRPVVAAPIPAPPPRNGPVESAPLPAPVAPAAPPVNAAGVWMATMLLLLGIAAGVGLFFVTFVWPLLD
jgi:hypothetical protein